MPYWTTLPPRFKSATFDRFKPQSSEQKNAKTFLKKFLSTKNDFSLPNVILLGNCGTGKTHLLYALLHQHGEHVKDPPFDFLKSNEILFLSLKDLIDEIKLSFKEKTTDKPLYQKAIEAPILLLDEIGIQYGTDMERCELFPLFNERYNACRPMVVTSNLTPQRLRQLFGQRIYERLFSKATIFDFQNQSYRFN